MPDITLSFTAARNGLLASTVFAHCSLPTWCKCGNINARKQLIWIHYWAKGAQIEKWPCISRVCDKIFMKFGHQIGCRDTKHLKKLNDIDTTSNDLEMTFNSVFQCI